MYPVNIFLHKIIVTDRKTYLHYTFYVLDIYPISKEFIELLLLIHSGYMFSKKTNIKQVASKYFKVR